jgi:hypothetical protein
MLAPAMAFLRTYQPLKNFADDIGRDRLEIVALYPPKRGVPGVERPVPLEDEPAGPVLLMRIK